MSDLAAERPRVVELDRNIKELIDEYPDIGNVLEEYDIVCTNCNVGSCLLRDIIEIHNMSLDQEDEVLSRIGEIIYPGQNVTIPRTEREVSKSRVSYSPPIKKLVDEHDNIKKLIAHIPFLISEITKDIDNGIILLGRSIEFIRTYADRFHHAKEEEILFSYCEDGAEIIEVMYQDHKTAREHVAAIVEAIEIRDTDVIATRLTMYAELLAEHIRKEDEVLYPWIDRNLTVTQVGELYSDFATADKDFTGDPDLQVEFVEELDTLTSVAS